MLLRDRGLDEGAVACRVRFRSASAPFTSRLRLDLGSEQYVSRGATAIVPRIKVAAVGGPPGGRPQRSAESMGSRPGSGDILVWCGSPAVLGVGSRVVLEEPEIEPGTWKVTVLDAKRERTFETITIDIRELVTEDMAE